MQEILTNSEITSEYTMYLVISFLNLSHINRKIIIFFVKKYQRIFQFCGREREPYDVKKNFKNIFKVSTNVQVCI